jgi:hypothetical protein
LFFKNWFHKGSKVVRQGVQILCHLGASYHIVRVLPSHSPPVRAICRAVSEPFSVEFAVPDREQGIADSYEGPHLPADDAFKDLPTLSLWPPSWRKSQKNFSYENFWAGHIMGGVFFCRGFPWGQNVIDENIDVRSGPSITIRGVGPISAFGFRICG